MGMVGGVSNGKIEKYVREGINIYCFFIIC